MQKKWKLCTNFIFSLLCLSLLLIVHAHSLYICLLVCLRKFKFYYHKFLVADRMQFCFQVLICIFLNFFCSHMLLRCKQTSNQYFFFCMKSHQKKTTKLLYLWFKKNKSCGIRTLICSLPNYVEPGHYVVLPLTLMIR